jgi:hypothetical protein
MRVPKWIIICIFLVCFIISAGCTVYEKEKDQPATDPYLSLSPNPQASPIGSVSLENPAQTQAAKPVSINPATGYPMESFTPEVTAVMQPNPSLMKYNPVYSQQYRLMFNLEGPYGLEIVCNEAPLRILFDSNPDNENPRLSYAYWQLTDMETEEVIEEGGYGREHSTQKKQTLDIFRTGTFHLNLYGARIDVKVIVLSPHAADIIPRQPRITSPSEDEEDYW